MIQLIETRFDVSLYEPVRSFPCALNVAQRSMTSTLWTKSMGCFTKLRLVICF